MNICPVTRDDIELVRAYALKGPITIRVPQPHEVYAGEVEFKQLIVGVDDYTIYAGVTEESVIACFVEAALAAALGVSEQYNWCN